MANEERDKKTFTANGEWGPHQHGKGNALIQGAGTWGGGSAALQVDTGGGYSTWYTINESDPARILLLPENCLYKIVLSGATTPNLTFTRSLKKLGEQ